MDKDVSIAVEVLECLISQHASALYFMEKENSRDWKEQYKHQLKIDRINEIINDLKLL